MVISTFHTSSSSSSSSFSSSTFRFSAAGSLSAGSSDTSSSSPPSSSATGSPSSPFSDRLLLYSSDSCTSASGVPFLWEEKPGICIKNREIMQKVSKSDISTALSHSCRTKRQLSNAGDNLKETDSDDVSVVTVVVGDDHATSNGIAQYEENATDRHDSLEFRPKVSRTFGPLRPPPRLLSSELAMAAASRKTASGTPSTSSAKSNSGIHVYGSTAGSGHRRRHHNRSTSTSLDADPFWLAMVACSNENYRNGGKMPLVDRKTNAPASRVRLMQHQSLHLDQCIPRRSRYNSISMGNIDMFPTYSCASSTASTPAATPSTAASAYNSCSRVITAPPAINEKPPLPAVHSNTTCRHHRHRSHSSSTSTVSTTSRKIAGQRSLELQYQFGKPQKQLQQQPVDLSCGYAARRKVVYKSKLPDLFGCRPNAQNWQ